MRYVCEAPGGKTWFRIETESEALAESEIMRHAVEKYFRKEQDKATQSFRPISNVFFEQEIGLKSHIQREMPLFLTPEVYVQVPLEATYHAAWEGMPVYWREVLTAAPEPRNKA